MKFIFEDSLGSSMYEHHYNGGFKQEKLNIGITD